MKMQWSHLLVGVLLGVCIMLIMGAAEDTPGRYQISSSANYVWVLDTATGQVWSSEKVADEENAAWIVSSQPKWYSYGNATVPTR